MGIRRAEKLIEWKEFLREVINHAAIPRSATSWTRFFTAVKCGWPKKIECLLDQELE